MPVYKLGMTVEVYIESSRFNFESKCQYIDLGGPWEDVGRTTAPRNQVGENARCMITYKVLGGPWEGAWRTLGGRGG